MEVITNVKAVGPDGLPVQMLNFGRLQDQAILMEFHRLVTLIWLEGEVPQHCEDIVTTVLHRKNDKTECGNYRGIALLSHAGKGALQIVARRLSDHFEAKRLSSDDQCEFWLECSATDIMLGVEGMSVTLHVAYWLPESKQHCQPHLYVAGAHSHLSTTAEDSSHPTIPRWDESLYVTW